MQPLLYSLTTCAYCKRIKGIFINNGVDFVAIDVDNLFGSARREVLAELAELNDRCSFPTLQIAGITIIGYNEQEIFHQLNVLGYQIA